MTQKKEIFIELSFLIVCGAVFYIALQPFPEPNDFLWHAVLGKDILHKGMGVFFDTYSFTMPGARISNVPWIFDLLSYFFSSHFHGMLGFQLLRALLWLVPLALIHWYCHRKKITVVVHVFGFLTTAYVCAALYWLRPELLSFSFLLIYMMLLPQALESFRPKLYLGFVFMQWVWDNCHSSSVFGYLILGSMYVEWAIRFIRQKEVALKWIQLLGLVLFSVGLSFVNPSLHSNLAALVRPMQQSYKELSLLIREYYYYPFTSLHISLQVYLILMIPMGLFYLRKRAWAHLFIFMVLFAEGLSLVKIWYHLIIASLPAMLVFLDHVYQSVKSLKSKRAVVITSLVLIALPVFNIVNICKVAKPSSKVDPAVMGSDLWDFMKENKMCGNTYMGYEVASSAIYFMGDCLKVYIDGRVGILYPQNLMQKFLETQKSPKVLFEEIQKYHMRYVILPKYAMRDIDSYITRGNLELLFVGEGFLLFKPSLRPTFFSQALYFEPSCIEKATVADFKENLTPPNSVLNTLSRIASDYVSLKGANPTHYLHDHLDLLKRDDGTLRLGTYLALKNQDLVLATELMKLIKYPTTIDYLNTAEINLKNQKPEAAEAHLVSVMNQLPAWALKRTQNLLMEFTKQYTPKIITQEQMVQLKKSSTMAETISLNNLNDCPR